MDIHEKILQDGQISEETFDETFNVFEQNNNIIHRAFKMAHGFGYLDGEDYPKDQIIEIFDTMTNLVKESLKRCDQKQKEVIQNIMLNEANIYNARYGAYKYFIDFKGLINLVLKEDPNQLEK